MSGRQRRGLGFSNDESTPYIPGVTYGTKYPRGEGRPDDDEQMPDDELERRQSEWDQRNPDGMKPPRLTSEQEAVLRDPRRVADLEKQVEYIAASGQSDDFEGDIGPWYGTPIYDRLYEAWHRGMKKRKYKSGGRF